MSIQRMDHVGVVVDDLDAAIDFFTELGLTSSGKATVGGDWVDRIVGLDGIEAEITMLETADAGSRLELVKFHSPQYEGDAGYQPSNVPGLRHLAFVVDDIDAAVAGLQGRGVDLVGEVVRYENSYILCYVHGPEGIIVELAQKVS